MIRTQQQKGIGIMQYTSTCDFCRDGALPQEAVKGRFGKHCSKCDREISAALARLKDLGIDIECADSISKTEIVLVWLLLSTLLTIFLFWVLTVMQ